MAKQRDFVIQSLSAEELMRQIIDLAAEKIADRATPDQLDKAINARIGQLTLAEAADKLSLRSAKAMKRICTMHRIEIVKLSDRMEHVMLSDIEDLQRRTKVIPQGLRKKEVLS